MRYLIQLVIPALIFASVVYLLTRQRQRQRSEESDAGRESRADTGAFLVILALGAVVSVAAAFALQSFWE